MKLPCAVDVEASILGGIILRNDVLLDLDTLEVQDFFDLRHVAVFAAIRNLAARQSPIDAVTLEAELDSAGKLDAVGGVAFLGELTLRVPTVDNVHEYARIVRGHRALRDAMLVAGAVSESAANFVDDPVDYLEERVAELQAIAQKLRDPRGAKHPRGFVSMADRVVGERADRLTAAAAGLRYHNAYLDDRLRMILPHDLVVITARTGKGKTDLATAIAMANAVDAGREVGYFALEAEPRELERRRKYAWLVVEAYRRQLPGCQELDFVDWMVGRCEHIVGGLEDEAQAWFASRARTIRTFYKGERRFDVHAMVSNIMELARRVDLICLDHIHYVDGSGEDENRSLTEIVTALRNTALAQGKPVLAVAHIRKRVGPERTLLPDSEELHGSSNLSKIITQVIAIGPAPFIEPPAPHLRPTLMAVTKCRRSGEDNLAAVCWFDAHKKRYRRDYTLGRLIKGGTEWEPLRPGDVPRWAREHKQLEMAID